MYKIALTGGPCSGKTTGISKIERSLTARGYKVLIVPETATELILNGVCECDEIAPSEFQDIILEKQLFKEKLYDKIAKNFDSDKTVILYDRTILDGMMFVGKNNFCNVLKKKKITISDALNRYDAVLHLVTAAEEAPEYYLYNNRETGDEGNNPARSERPEEAIETDHRARKIFVKHPHFRIINGEKNFDDKMQNLMNEVYSVIGLPVPTEKEKKFLIKKPDENTLENLEYSSKVEIIQTYLKRTGNTERRIRQRGNRNDGYSFYYTEKTDIREGERLEIERRISKREYIDFFDEIDTNFHQIHKTRYCFIYKKKFFELDIYPFSDEYAILEIELQDLNEDIEMPPFIEIVKDVTADKNYKNFSIAKNNKFI